MSPRRRGPLEEQYDRGRRDGKAGVNKPSHGFWKSLASALGLLRRPASRRQRMDNNAYQAGRKLGKSERGRP